MTNDNKPPMFGPSAVLDLATYEPRAGKTFWMAATDEAVVAILSNCTITLPLKSAPNLESK